MSATDNDWNDHALLLIDVQQDFWPADIATAHPDFEHNVTSLLALCRAEGIDVVHLHAAFKPDRTDWMLRYRLGDGIPCVAGTPGAEVLPCARPAPGEQVFVKQTFDAFLQPDFARWLDASDKRILLLAGLQTSVCVLLTAAAAAQRGFLACVVEDCCADQADAHAQTLAKYPFIFDRTGVDRIRDEHGRWRAALAQLDESARSAMP